MINNKYPRRRSIRLEGFDYSQPGAYFITAVTLNRACMFETIFVDQVNLNPIGRLVESEWQRLEQRFSHIQLGSWIVMPNHIHGIIHLIQSEIVQQPFENADLLKPLEQFGSPIPGYIPTIIRSFKSSVTQQHQNLYRDYSTKIWQRNYYDHIIRGESDLENIHDYILDNPRKWTEDENFSR